MYKPVLIFLIPFAFSYPVLANSVPPNFLAKFKDKKPAQFQKFTDDQRRQLATANSKEAQDALLIKWGMKSLDDPNGSLNATIDKYESATSDRERAALSSTIKTYYYVSDNDDERQMIRQVFVDHPVSTETATASALTGTAGGRAPASTSR